VKPYVIYCFDPRAAEIPQKPAIGLVARGRYLPRQTREAASPPLCYQWRQRIIYSTFKTLGRHHAEAYRAATVLHAEREPRELHRSLK
jgi:hypothetical protein